MADTQAPIRTQPAGLLEKGYRHGQGTLLLYPDKLVHVASRTAYWAGVIGLTVVTVLSFALAGGGPGALGALIGFGAGSLIGSAIAKRQATRKQGEPGTGVTIVPLTTIATVDRKKAAGIAGRLRRQTLVVGTHDGQQTTFGVNPDKWLGDLNRAIAADITIPLQL